MNELKATPGPWAACGEHKGGCSCGQVWSRANDHPVAQVISGEWGDEWPAIRPVKDPPGMAGTVVEAYMDHAYYGRVDEQEAKANAALIAAAPALYAALDALKRAINFKAACIVSNETADKVMFADDQVWKAVDDADAALKKARGE